MSRLLFAIAWIAACGVVFAMATVNATLMGVSGLIAAVAALGWGFTVHGTHRATPDGSCTVCDHPFGDQRHICIGRDTP